MGFFNAVIGAEFFHTCYDMMGDFMDFMALINSAVNFILYCLMSKQFRKTFAEMLGISPKLLKSEFCQNQYNELFVQKALCGNSACKIGEDQCTGSEINVCRM